MQSLSRISLGSIMKLHNLKQTQIDCFLLKGDSANAIICPTAIMTCRGERAKDGRFDENPDGPEWIAFEEIHHSVFWQPLTGEIATDTGRAFAFGEELFDNPATTAFDQNLNIYAGPLEWLQCERRGIVVLNWKIAFDRLLDVTRIAVAEELLGTYKRCMRPLHMPKLFVLPGSGGLVS